MSVFKTLGKIGMGALGVLAPTIAGALPGPLGSIAKAAVTEALGLDKESNDEQIEKALATTNPEVLAKLRKAEQDFKLQMEQLGIDLEKVLAEDRTSARQRHILVRDKTPPALAWTITGAWLVLTGALYVFVPPEQNSRLLDMMFGILTSAVVGVVGYYFGSSVGSARKTEIMNSASSAASSSSSSSSSRE